MTSINYIGACFDSSGYAEAARNNIAALHQVGVSVSVAPVSFEGKKANLGELGTLIQSLVHPNTKHRIRIIHTTPHHYPQLRKDGCYNIGYMAWETSKLTKQWTEWVKCMDEIWVPSEHNVQALKDSGITKPVICIPHTFQFEEKKDLPKVMIQHTEDKFVFYSIFQWLERKNPIGLLIAYLTEFTPEDNVVLILKTFRLRPGDSTDANQIKEAIQQIKSTLFLDSYPSLLLISNLLTSDQVKSLHHQSDCYISLQRCEGFGIPIAEAMQAGNPAIVTNYSGPADFVNDKTGYLVNYMLTPVAGMPWEQYRGDAIWAEPDLMHARKLMRQAYNNRREVREKGDKARKWIEKNLSYETVGNKMKARLEEIERSLV